MKDHRLSQLVTVVVMLLAVVVTCLGATSASAAQSALAFKASVSGTVSSSDSLTFQLAGTGNASYLGKLESYQANGLFTGTNTDTLTETLTAANGDTLIILCSQVIEDVSPGVFHGTDTWHVIGGTGRFSNTTGSGTGETNVDLNAGTFAKEMTGSITT